MEITFPLRELISQNISPNQFTIGLLVFNKRWGFLRDIKNNIGKEDFNKQLEDLRIKEFIKYNSIGNIVSIKDITVTDNFIKIITLEDPFAELYELYPSSAIRPDHKTDYLRKNKAKCIILYKKTLKNKPTLHKHILKCLKFEIEDRTKKGALGWMKRLENWLKNEEWQIYEQMMTENITSKAQLPDKKKQKETYGTGLL